MSLESKGRLHEPEASRTIIYVGQDVAGDSQFPFEDGQDLWIRIDAEEDRLIVEAYDGQEGD